MLQLLYFPLYVFYVVAFLLLIFRAKFFDFADVKKAHLAFFFLLKVAAGLVLTLVYTYYYTDQSKADIYRYFNDSKVISSILFTNPLAWLKIISGIGTFDPGTFKYLQDTGHFTHPAIDFVTSNSLLIRIISLLNYFSFYNIYIDTLLLNCFTFTALTGLLKSLLPYFRAFPQILYWPLFLMPSFVFWSSGLLKEGLMFVGISLYLSSWLKGMDDRNLKSILMLFIGVILIMYTKIYVAVVMVVCTIFLPLKKMNRIVKSSFVIRLFLCLAIGMLVWEYYGDYLCNSLMYKRSEFIQLSVSEHSGSIIDTAYSEPAYSNLVKLVPAGLVNAVIRPFIWDKGPVIQLLFAIENLFFLTALILLLLLYFKRPEGDKFWIALFCFFFSVLNYLVIGITIPIFGAIVLYRIVAMPFLLLSVLLFSDLDKLKSHLFQLHSFLRLKS